MPNKLFLLDGMALVYRAHFALIRRPIFTSKGVNTSALFGFTQTLLDIINTQKPTHLAVAFDTEEPTARHLEFPEYKAQREAMPEDISFALPHITRLLDCFRIPVLTCPGCEADDIIGTLVRRAEKADFVSYMVTPDKDFCQLVSDQTFLYKPGRMGDRVEILGVPEVLAKWGLQNPGQVVDLLGLWGDLSDNVPGVPGIGEKTAGKLIAQYGSIENLLAHTSELKGKVKEALETHRDQALLSKRLVTITCDAPVQVELDSLKIHPPDEPLLRQFCIEFEFNSIGRRLFGDDFRAGHGFDTNNDPDVLEETLLQEAENAPPAAPEPPPAPVASLQHLADVRHDYRIVSTENLAQLLKTLQEQPAFGLSAHAAGPGLDRVAGLAFSGAPHTAHYLPMPDRPDERRQILDELQPILASEKITKIGHDLKADLTLLKRHGLRVGGPLFDTMLAHSLAEPEMRHTLTYLAEALLGYSPMARPPTAGGKDQMEMSTFPPDRAADAAMERADLAVQLHEKLVSILKDKGQERVFYDIEAPLLPVLVDMENEGVRVDAASLDDFARHLSLQMAGYERTIHQMAGREFNLNSPRQLGEILFDVLKLADKPKKTKTGQYATNEQTLLTLASQHEIVRTLLDYRAASKLKSTYADTLPTTIHPQTGRIHTTYNQAITATGRLQSQDPNLQNIPIRTELGQEIRKAFVPRNGDYLLLSADYSQIELRIIAALSHETAMLEAFQQNLDIHTATAARVFGVQLEQVTPEMRRRAKMVNFGIAYGISAFGLSQRLGIPRKDAAAIIDQYFAKYPGIARYMTDTIAFAKKHGYVETVTGRRRYIRDIRSSNATIRGAAERNAINAPIQGTAADMIKIAMARIHQELDRRHLRTRLLLQVHDELVFDLYRAEEPHVAPLIEHHMKTAIPLDVPIVVEIGTGKTWLEAH